MNKNSITNQTKILIGVGAVALVAVLSLVLIFVYNAGYDAGTTDSAVAGQQDWAQDDAFDLDLADIDFGFQDQDFSDLSGIPAIANNHVVGTINGVDLLAHDVGFSIREAEFRLMDEGLINLFPGDPDIDFTEVVRGDQTLAEVVREEAVRRAGFIALFTEYAQQHGIALSSNDYDEIEFQMTQMAMQFSPEDFGYVLRADGVQDITHLEQLFHAFTLMELVVDYIMDSPDAFAEFETYMVMVEFPTEEILAATHILAAFDNFDSEEEATAFATELLARAQAGEDFDMLVQTYGQDPGMMGNPDGYTFTPGAMVPEFESATRAMNYGEISELVRTDFGYHIIKRLEPVPGADVMRPWGAPQPPSHEQMMFAAIQQGFEVKLENATFTFTDALNDVPVGW